jgi:esterase/lipase superfamily enzyme
MYHVPEANGFVKPVFSVSASAAAATGYIRRTDEPALTRTLPRIASVKSGSKQSANSGPVAVRDLLSIGEAYAFAEEHETPRQEELLSTTKVRLSDVVVAGRLRVGRLEAGFLSLRKGSELIAFRPYEIAYEDITLDGRRILVDLEPTLIAASETFSAFERAHRRVPRKSSDARLRNARVAEDGYLISSIVSRIHLSDPSTSVQGHIIGVAGFGRIYFGEFIVSRVSRSLTMMRFELGSPVQAGLSFASTESIAIPIEETPERPEKAIVRIFFATDRRVASQRAGQVRFDNVRSVSGEVTLGTCEVSIPRDHRLARLEAPAIWRLQFRPDPRKHVVVRKTAALLPEKFYEELAARTAVSRQVFVFVHGYNVSFNDAVRRTAQLAYDLQFPGAAILFSWPSFAHFRGYWTDEATIEWSIPHLAAFLKELAHLGGAETIHLIGHSMGNRALTRALERVIPDVTHGGALFQEVVLTAPDIDAGVFGQIASEIARVSQRITMYASPRDKALLASRLFHTYARAGEQVIVVPGVDTVDASAVDTSLIGHSFFGDNRSVLSDMYAVMRSAPPEERFGLSKVFGPTGVYYTFQS